MLIGGNGRIHVLKGGCPVATGQGNLPVNINGRAPSDGGMLHDGIDAGLGKARRGLEIKLGQARLGWLRWAFDPKAPIKVGVAIANRDLFVIMHQWAVDLFVVRIGIMRQERDQAWSLNFP